MNLSFGSLDPVLQKTTPSLLSSSGPVSDAFIVGAEPMMLLNGPIGSAKTTSEAKKALFETTRMRPWQPTEGEPPVREYNLVVYREKYDSLWNATIRSWKKIFPEEIWKIDGSRGRPADQKIEWEDEWSRKGGGICRLRAMFRAFGEQADPEEVRGTEYADALLQEWDLLPEPLTIAISGRLARAPTRKIMGRTGRIYGSCNAPDVLSYVYRDFFEEPPPGYKLYRQPGGLDADAENIDALGREYYLDIIEKNGHRIWYVRRMVHNKPGFTRDHDIVYPGYDDDVNLSSTRLEPIRSLRVIVGVDGGNTPAAVYMQETPAGQLRILDEIALESSGMIALSRAMLRLEAERYEGCKFHTVADPAMDAGHETEEGSDRQRLAKLLKRPVHKARTNDPERRVEPIRAYLERRLDDGRPGLLLDKVCNAMRRGFNQTYHYRRVRGSNERSSIVKTPDSHPHDGAGYAAMETSQGLSARLEENRTRKMRERAQASREAGRYSPFGRKR